MSDIKYTNQIIDKSIPDFIKSDYPLFVDMMTAYYDWLSETKNSIDIVNSNYRDIDQTLDEFLEFFRKEYLTNIPFNLNIDKRLLVKHIREFYRNKGNEQSYKFLFRILFNENIELYYPKVDILKASDGKWQQTISIKILKDEDIPLSAFFSNNIIGLTSNSLGKVDNISNYFDRGIEIYEINLQTIKGNFLKNELLQIGNYYTTVLEVVSGIKVNAGGTGYKINEVVEIIDNGQQIGTGKIVSVGRGEVTGLTIVNPGIGYNGTQREIEEFIYLPINTIWEGLDLLTATIQGDSNQYDFYSSTINFPITTTLVPGTGDIIRIRDTPIQVGQGAVGRVSLVSQIGEILNVELIQGGRDYAAPVATVDSNTGTGANITAHGGGGSIKSIALNDFPIVQFDSNGNETSTINIITENGHSAVLELIPDGGTIKYPGFWKNDDGKLSSNKVLQDNYYYQEFSYVILSSVTETRWKEILEKVLHPSGFELFGEIKITGTASIETNIDADAEIVTL